jgi:Domain of unknown function (DUF4168)
MKSANFRSFLGIPATLLFAATVVAAGSIAGTARAQNGAPAAQAAPSAVKQFSEQDLQSYASAALQVQTISKNARDQIKGSNDVKATDDIQKKAQQDAVAAVKQQGLTVQKYNEIAVAMRTDPAVREKVLDYVQKLK